MNITMAFECNDDGTISPYYVGGGAWEKSPPEEVVQNNPNLDYHFFYAEVTLAPLSEPPEPETPKRRVCTCSPYFGCSEYAPDCPVHGRK